MVLLVALRSSIGCHFLYEGVWKIRNADKFSAKPFLTMAKGPAAPLFYAMVPDLDGRERLKVEPTARADRVLAEWTKVRTEAKKRLNKHLKDNKAKDAKQVGTKFDRASQRLLWEHQDKLEACLSKHDKAALATAQEASGQKSEKTPEAVAALLAEMAEIQKQHNESLSALILEQPGGKKPSLRVLGAGDVSLKPADDGAVAVMAGSTDVLRLGDGVKGVSFLDSLQELKEDTIGKFGLDETQQFFAERAYRQYRDGVQQYLYENAEDIIAYHGSLDRFEKMKAAGTDASDYKKKRIWDEQQKLRGEVGKWLGAIDAMGEDYQAALWRLLDEDQREMGDLPVAITFGDFLDFAVTYGLTAIGLCLMIGLATRFACLGGAAFLVSVLLTQPPWPTIYPPVPAAVGHAMLVDKNFVEMVALLVLASTAVGRWGGLDYFVENYVIGLWKSLSQKKNIAGDK